MYRENDREESEGKRVGRGERRGNREERARDPIPMYNDQYGFF